MPDRTLAATRRNLCVLGGHLGTLVHTPTTRLGQANDSVDQVLADEPITTVSQPGTVYWPLADNLGTVRDLAVYNGSATTVGNHRVFDAFGNATNTPLVDLLFAYTGRPLDRDTGLQNNLHRWYEPANGRWLSEDPIGFAAGDANLYRYVGNGVTNATDPSGLSPSGGTKGGGITAPNTDNVTRAIIVVIHGRNGTAGVTGGMAMLAREIRTTSKHTVVEVGFGEDPKGILGRYFDARAGYNRCIKTVPIIFVGYSNGGARAIELADWAHKEIGSRKNCSNGPLKPRIGVLTFDAVFGEILGAAGAADTAVKEGPDKPMEWAVNYYVDGGGGYLDPAGGEITRMSNNRLMRTTILTEAKNFPGYDSKDPGAHRSHLWVDEYMVMTQKISGRIIASANSMSERVPGIWGNLP